jgi:tetrahydromethanopterin S-methyltransferase subunit C
VHYFQDFPAPRGEPKPKYVKYAMGLPIITLIVVIIFGPLLAYSLVNHIGTQRLPIVVTATVEIEGFPVGLFLFSFLNVLCVLCSNCMKWKRVTI